MTSKHNELARQKVFVKIYQIGSFGKLSEVLADIDKLGINYKDIEFVQDYDVTYFGYYRDETDDEYNKRIKPYTAKLKKKEEDERKLYLKLKQKFEFDHDGACFGYYQDETNKEGVQCIKPCTVK